MTADTSSGVTKIIRVGRVKGQKEFVKTVMGRLLLSASVSFVFIPMPVNSFTQDSGSSLVKDFGLNIHSARMFSVVNEIDSLSFAREGELLDSSVAQFLKQVEYGIHRDRSARKIKDVDILDYLDPLFITRIVGDIHSRYETLQSLSSLKEGSTLKLDEKYCKKANMELHKLFTYMDNKHLREVVSLYKPDLVKAIDSHFILSSVNPELSR